MDNNFEQSWYEEEPDPFAPLRSRGIMPSNNEKQFDKDSDLTHNDKVNDAISNNDDTSQPNKPSKNYPENNSMGDSVPYEGYKSGKM
jgi:hypothetical protein